MKKVICIVISILFLSFVQNDETEIGNYVYQTDTYYESILLDEKFKFKYKYRTHFVNSNLEGNYKIIGDSLILDSNPQKDRIIVRESKKGNKFRDRIIVTDKLGAPINYF